MRQLSAGGEGLVSMLRGEEDIGWFRWEWRIECGTFRSLDGESRSKGAYERLN